MSFSLIPALLLAAQAAPPVVAVPRTAPPVVTVSQRPAPVIVAAPPRPSPQDEAKLRAVAHRIDVRLSAGREVIWQGPLLVSMRQGAQVSYSKTEASQPLCQEDLSSHDQVQSGVNIGVRSTGDRALANRYMLDIRWTRPAEERGCGMSGTRAVDVDQTVLLPVGETVTVQGDGGLVIQVTRRD